MGSLCVRSFAFLLFQRTDLLESSYAQSPGAIPFAQASYTLRVFDERGPSAIASGGYFSGQNSLVVFAMYSPAAYTPLANGWTCSACKSFATRLEGGGNLLAMMSVMVAAILIGGASVLQS